MAASARVRLLAWDRRLAADSHEATLYAFWEDALLRRLARGRLDSSLVDDFLAGERRLLVPVLAQPASVWFDGPPVQARDALLIAALARQHGFILLSADQDFQRVTRLKVQNWL